MYNFIAPQKKKSLKEMKELSSFSFVGGGGDSNLLFF